MLGPPPAHRRKDVTLRTPRPDWSAVRVPAFARAQVIRRWPERGRAWAAAVHSELVALGERLDAVEPQVMASRFGFVVAVRTPLGALVLRSCPDPDGAAQAEHSRQLAELGVSPAVHEVFATETSTWTVMDRVVPGTTFYDADITPDVLAELGRALRLLHTHAAADPGRPRIDLWLRARLERAEEADVAPGSAPVAARERRAALDILDELVGTEYVPGLIHGDTSFGNLLVGPAGSVVLIDPRAMSGEVACDVAVVLFKGEQDGLRLDADRLAAAAGVDVGRVRGWQRVAAAARM